MRIFKLSDNIEVVCEFLPTSYGFRHIAHLMVNGNEVEKSKCCYYNRTWEKYEFETVMVNLIYKSKRLDEYQKDRFLEIIKNYN